MPVIRERVREPEIGGKEGEDLVASLLRVEKQLPLPRTRLGAVMANTGSLPRKALWLERPSSSSADPGHCRHHHSCGTLMMRVVVVVLLFILSIALDKLFVRMPPCCVVVWPCCHRGRASLLLLVGRFGEWREIAEQSERKPEVVVLHHCPSRVEAPKDRVRPRKRRKVVSHC